MALQQRAGADAGQLQNLGRVDGTRAQQYLTLGLHGDHFIARPDFSTGAALAAVWQVFQNQAADLGAGPHLKVGASITGRAQKGFGRVPAPAGFLVDLEVAHAFVVAAVEVVAGGNASLLRGL